MDGVCVTQSIRGDESDNRSSGGSGHNNIILCMVVIIFLGMGIWDSKFDFSKFVK